MLKSKYSLWDGVFCSLDLTEELLRYAVIEGELAIQHGEQDHTKSPHVTGFTTVRPTWRQERGSRSVFVVTISSATLSDIEVLCYNPKSDKPQRLKSTFV